MFFHHLFIYMDSKTTPILLNQDKEVKEMSNQELNDRMVAASDRRYNKLYQENTLFTNRLSLFFVAESMLFISYVSAINLAETTKFFGIIICTLGIAVTFSFALVFFGHVNYINKLKEKLDKFDEEYPKDYNDILGKSLPMFFVAVWVILAIMY